jgi:hypothetical protein
MTQEEKQLLLKDLSARLPYGVKVNFRGNIEILREVHIYKSVQTIIGESGMLYDIDMPFVKPYFRPMSSMTEEEKLEYVIAWDSRQPYLPTEAMDWLNAHHLDYRGLIEKGLALEAPADMY